MSATTLDYFSPVGAAAEYEGLRAPPFRTRVAQSAELDAATNEYADRGFEHQFAKLQSLTKDRSLTQENVEMPTLLSQSWARVMLETLQFHNFPPTRVVSSAEGGIAICFVSGDKCADVEFLNSGEILGVVANRRDRPLAWEVEQSSRGLTRAAIRIREFIDTPAPRAHASRWPWR